MEKALIPETLEALRNNPKDTLEKLVYESIGELKPPSQRTNDAIWIIVVITFALVMLYSAWILGSGVTQATTESPITKSDTILTIFMSVVGFLAGLLSPGPIKK